MLMAPRSHMELPHQLFQQQSHPGSYFSGKPISFLDTEPILEHAGSGSSDQDTPLGTHLYNSPFAQQSAAPGNPALTYTQAFLKQQHHQQEFQHQQQQQQQMAAPAQRQRQQLIIPPFPMSAPAPKPFSLTNVPPLLATDEELVMLEPLASPPLFSPTSLNLAASRDSAMGHHHRRTVSSSQTWEKPVVSTGHHYAPTSTDSVSTHPAARSTFFPTPSLDKQISSHCGAHSTTSGPSPPNSGSLMQSPSAHESAAVRPIIGATSSVVQAMLAELPPDLSQVVMAKVSVRGRGGRQPAADPRSSDPSMDPRKVRRILANRQSAARSKLKQRVLLETLRVGKDVMVAQQGNVQEEVARLSQLVHELEQRNRELEQRLQMMSHQQQPQGSGMMPHLLEQTGVSRNEDALEQAAKGWWEEGMEF